MLEQTWEDSLVLLISPRTFQNQREMKRSFRSKQAGGVMSF